DGDDRDLADLDADVEGRECRGDGICRQPDLPQRAGEAEAARKAEGKGPPPAAVYVAREEIFHRDKDDRRRDGGLDERAWNDDDVERSEREGDRIGDDG